MTHRNSIRLLAAFIILAGSGARTLFAAEPGPLQRYGIIIGVNDGGPSRGTLKFATTDAEAFAAVMQEMGGLAAGQRILLVNPDRRAITQSFADMKKRLGDEKELFRRQEFVLYYSGHSDEEGLLINGERLAYKELRSLVAGIPSDVRIAVIDSCASGVFIRTKGGVPQPPFLVDASTDMKGYAFLTSSSETEAAQESDHIEGSFFTHYLVSGLRGAADATQDGVVTLNEAYHFAFNETLVRTEKTKYGPQHASYDIQLSGTGDLVLTDLRETSAGLVIAEEIEGRIYIRNARGKLVVELNKQENTRDEIGLAPGAYSVLVDAPAGLRRADVKLTAGCRALLATSDLAAVKAERTVRRGDDDEEPVVESKPDETATAEPAAPPATEFLYRPFRFTFFPNPVRDDEDNVVVVNTAVFNLTVGVAEQVRGAGFSVIGGIIEHDLSGFQGASVFNISGGRANAVQAAGVFNIAGDSVTGAQLAGVFNIAGAGVTGFQGAGVFNIAGGPMTGVQAATLNVAEDVTGGQVGVVNIARKVTGVQVGLVNIADENEGFALGLVSYSRNGIHNFEFWQGSDNMSQLAFKFGTKYFYTILLGGYNFIDRNNEWCYGLGWGAHLPVGKFFFDLDAFVTSRRSDDGPEPGDGPVLPTLLPQLRAKAGWQITDGIAFFAGVDFQVYHPSLYYDPTLVEDFLFEIPSGTSLGTCKVVPRFFLGVQVF